MYGHPSRPDPYADDDAGLTGLSIWITAAVMTAPAAFLLGYFAHVWGWL